MPKVRWSSLGPPTSPTVAYVRGIGNVRITEEDIEKYGGLGFDTEVICERVTDDPEATYRITGLAPGDAWPAGGRLYDKQEEELADDRGEFSLDDSPAWKRPKSTGRRARRGGKRSWLDVILGR